MQALTAGTVRNESTTSSSATIFWTISYSRHPIYTSILDFAAGQTFSYTAQREGNGIYLFVIDGAVEVAGETLAGRDGLGSKMGPLRIHVRTDSRLLIMDVPL
jgi:redox-sensitive bicupin YhaK (pirin superfamily)